MAQELLSQNAEFVTCPEVEVEKTSLIPLTSDTVLSWSDFDPFESSVMRKHCD